MTAAKFGKVMHARYPIVVGTDKLFEDYAVDAPPVSIVISRSGKVLLAEEGFDGAKIAKALRPEFLAMKAEKTAGHAPAKLPAALKSASPSTGRAKASEARGPFPDVPPDHWAAAAVQMLQQRGIVVGYP